MTEKKPLRKGQGRRQFIACQGRIKELIAEGYDISQAYDKLVEENLISMSYAGFYDLVTQRKRKKKTRPMLVEREEPPLFPQGPPIQPMAPSQPNLEHPGKRQVSGESQKPAKPLPPSALAPNSSAEARRKAVQDSLSQNLKASEKFVNEPASESDSEYDEMAKRLI